jgi:hypothetical protein
MLWTEVRRQSFLTGCDADGFVVWPWHATEIGVSIITRDILIVYVSSDAETRIAR